MLELPPLSLYVHLPWCVRKCPYCDFNSHERQSPIPEAAYLGALKEDLHQELAALDNSLSRRPLASVFFGGGTPSLLGAAFYADFLHDLDQAGLVSQNTEITLEANPGTAEASRFRDFREAGINRLSLGIQSFDDAYLKKLGRIHDSAGARNAIEIARGAGYDNLNLDLMFGLPGQSTKQAIEDLEIALGFDTPHLSWYQLTIEPNTVFYNEPPRLPAENVLIDTHQSGIALLQNAGLARYEVSAFARQGLHCRHNQNYWEFGDYIGIGAGAHGKYTLPEQQAIIRTRKSRQPESYMYNSLGRSAGRDDVPLADRPLEFLMNGLRLVDGFRVESFEKRTGVPFSAIRKQVESLVQRGLIELNESSMRATEEGYWYLDSILQEFLPSGQ